VKRVVKLYCTRQPYSFVVNGYLVLVYILLILDILNVLKLRYARLFLRLSSVYILLFNTSDVPAFCELMSLILTCLGILHNVLK